MDSDHSKYLVGNYASPSIDLVKEKVPGGIVKIKNIWISHRELRLLILVTVMNTG